MDRARLSNPAISKCACQLRQLFEDSTCTSSIALLNHSLPNILVNCSSLRSASKSKHRSGDEQHRKLGLRWTDQQYRPGQVIYQLWDSPCKVTLNLRHISSSELPRLAKYQVPVAVLNIAGSLPLSLRLPSGTSGDQVDEWMNVIAREDRRGKFICYSRS
jgi:hypothetical protein